MYVRVFRWCVGYWKSACRGELCVCVCACTYAILVAADDVALPLGCQWHSQRACSCIAVLLTSSTAAATCAANESFRQGMLQVVC